jgi:hypothetical protein
VGDVAQKAPGSTLKRSEIRKNQSAIKTWRVILEIAAKKTVAVY